MKINTLIKLSDGRTGRTVYNNLDGVGIKLDCPPLSKEEEQQLRLFNAPDEYKPDVMLRGYYPNAFCECYDGDYEIIEE